MIPNGRCELSRWSPKYVDDDECTDEAENGRPKRLHDHDILRLKQHFTSSRIINFEFTAFFQ